MAFVEHNPCPSNAEHALLTVHVSLIQTGAPTWHHAAHVMQAVFNDVKGDECVFLWRAIGAALVSLVSVTSYSLRVGPLV